MSSIPITDRKNQVAISFEPDDPDTFPGILDSSVTAKAIGFYGVKREAAKVFLVLDEGF